MLIIMPPEAQKIAAQAAERFTKRYEKLRNRWVYDEGSYSENNSAAVWGEIALGVAMGAAHFPSSAHWPYDFVAHGWRVDVKTSKSGRLQVRKGHARKLNNSDVLALARVEGIDRVEFLGWIWCDEFKQKATLQKARHTEPVLTVTHLLKPLHWRWIMNACATRKSAKGPPWPGSPGEFPVPDDSGMQKQWNTIVRSCEVKL
jgi:hypothetical protein